MHPKNCLTCKYEPDWLPLSSVEYPRRMGVCKWDKEMPALPKPFLFIRNSIHRYSDDSGVPENCKAWGAKP